VDSAQIDIDPARPRTGQSLPSVAAPGLSDRLDQSNRQAILLAGGASIKLTPSGGSIVDRLTTTYKQNDQGASDPTWFDLSTKRTVSYLRWDWDNRMERKYQDFKLASDGTNFAPGQAVVTPSTIRGEAISWFSEKEQDGLVENLDQFREALIVERNTTDLNRLDAILRPDVINKFVVSATKLQFKL
jgi:phage tail sheath gpL-like